MALVKFTGVKVVINGHPFVKDETLPFPQGFFFRHLFQIFENASLQVIDLFKALLFQVGSGFLTTDAAGTEHGHFLVPGRVQALFHILGKLPEGSGFRVDGALEGAHFHFIIIAGIDQQGFRITDHRVPFLRAQIGAHGTIGVDAFHPHGDNFFLELHLGTQEGMRVVEGFLVLQIRQTGILTEPAKYRVDTRPWTGDGAVNALVGQQQGAAHILCEHQRQKGLAQLLEIAQTDKLVQGSNDDAVRPFHFMLTHALNSGSCLLPPRQSGDSLTSPPLACHSATV